MLGAPNVPESSLFFSSTNKFNDVPFEIFNSGMKAAEMNSKSLIRTVKLKS